MKLKKAICCIATAGMLFTAERIAAAQPFPQNLSGVETVLRSSEQVLTGIDVSTLSIQYREGQYLDNTRTRGLRYVQMARDVIAQVRSEARISSLLLLVTSLRGLDSQIETLLWRLRNLRPLDERSGKKALEWISMVDDAADSLSKAVNRFEDDAFQFTANIDARLAKCP